MGSGKEAVSDGSASTQQKRKAAGKRVVIIEPEVFVFPHHEAQQTPEEEEEARETMKKVAIVPLRNKKHLRLTYTTKESLSSQKTQTVARYSTVKLEAGCKNETTTETDDSVARLEAGYNEEARIQQGGGGGTGKMWVGFDSCWCCCWYGCACCCKASAGHHKRLTPEMVNRKLYCCMQAERLSKVVVTMMFLVLGLLLAIGILIGLGLTLSTNKSD